MRRRTALLATGCIALAMMAFSASASASTLSLAILPSIEPGGSLGATITATGTAEPNLFGSDELDVFAGPSGSTCAPSASDEDQNLGFPISSSAAYPGFRFVNGTFSQTIGFGSGSSPGTSYLVCGYITEGGIYPTPGITEATAQTVAVLSPVAVPLTPSRPSTPPVPAAQPAPTGTLHLRLSSAKVTGRRSRVTVTMNGTLSSTAAPATLIVDIEDPPCDARDDFSTASVRESDFKTMLTSTGSFRRSFVHRFTGKARSSSGNTVAVCAYLGHPGSGVLEGQPSDAVFYARTRADLLFSGPF